METARGSASLDDPPLGRLRGRGAQLGAITRLSLVAGAILAAQGAALAGLPAQLRCRRDLADREARGDELYSDWLHRFGASADEAAARWLDGSVDPEAPDLASPPPLSPG